MRRGRDSLASGRLPHPRFLRGETLWSRTALSPLRMTEVWDLRAGTKAVAALLGRFAEG